MLGGVLPAKAVRSYLRWDDRKRAMWIVDVSLGEGEEEAVADVVF
jgi:hypothetical protein